ncbi:MAG: uroporphyrinogen decarboxylase family protein, partial [Candidatus Dormibacteraceae bacterium]
AADVERLRTPPAAESVPQVLAAVRQVVAASPVPVICFSGAPFTLASYLIEGRPTRDFKLTKTFMYRQPEAWDALLGKLAEVIVDYLRAQVEAGAQAIQLFDSWMGALAPDDYQRRVLPHSRHVFEATAGLGVPRIHFGTSTAGLLELMTEAGPDVVSLDWRVRLDEGWRRVGDRAVQGNLDPAVLLGPPELVRERATDILARAGGRPGHIFNLGHGVLPETPLASIQVLVETVHAWGAVAGG